MKPDQKDKIKWQAWMPYLAIIFMGILLVFRACYGMDTTDETYYLSSAKRFYNGDLFLKDDWNLGSLMGMVLLPLYRFYVFFHGNNEGIILFARILFVLLEVFTAAFLFRLLYRRTGNCPASLLPALCVLLYARANIITFSYYSLSMHTYLLAVLWRLQADVSPSKTKWCMIFSGVSFAVSVLCIPHLTILFFALTAAGLYRCRKKQDPEQRFFYFMLGIFLSAAVFLLYAGKLIPWTEIFQYLPIAFEDPTIEKENLFQQYADTAVYLATVFMKYTRPIYFAAFAGVLAYKKLRKKSERLKKWLTWGLIGEFLVQAVYVRTFFEGGIILVFLLFSIQYQLLHPEARDRQMEKSFLLTGSCFSAVWVLGSNVGHRVINMGFLIMDIWAVQIVFKGFQKQKLLNRWKRFPAYVLLAVLFIIRFFDVYRDGDPTKLTRRVSAGVMKGIRTEEHRAEAYEEAVSFLKRETKTGDMVFAVGCSPWVYLDAPGRCGSYSTWTVSGQDPLAEKYYRTFPERKPDILLLLPPKLNTYESWRFSSHGAGLHTGEEWKLEGYFAALAEEENYEKQKKGEITWYEKDPSGSTDKSPGSHTADCY